MTKKLIATENNAFDSILLIENGKVTGQWDLTKEVAQSYLECKDANEWEGNCPDFDEVETYGEEAEINEVVLKYI